MCIDHNYFLKTTKVLPVLGQNKCRVDVFADPCELNYKAGEFICSVERTNLRNGLNIYFSIGQSIYQERSHTNAGAVNLGCFDN